MVTLEGSGRRKCLPYLEQDFGAHAEETVDDPECEYHGHTVDVPGIGLDKAEVVRTN